PTIWHVPRQAHHLGPCSVGRPVIDEYDLVIAARRRAGGRKPLHKFAKPFFFVVAGYDRGQLFRCCRSQAGKAPRERNAQPGLFLSHEIRPRLTKGGAPPEQNTSGRKKITQLSCRANGPIFLARPHSNPRSGGVSMNEWS